MTDEKPVQRQQRKREQFAMRATQAGALMPWQGVFVAADTYTSQRLRAKGYRPGDLVFVEIRKPRSPGFHRLAHRLGMLCTQQIDDFHGLNPHEALKKLQLDGKIGCEESRAWVLIDGEPVAQQQILTPRSLAYESMDQGEFHEIMTSFCRYIAQRYWPDMQPEQIREMADSFVEEV